MPETAPETLVLTETDDRGVMTVPLSHPPANCSTHEMMLQLDRAILAARSDPQVRVLVLRGAGEGLSAYLEKRRAEFRGR